MSFTFLTIAIEGTAYYSIFDCVRDFLPIEKFQMAVDKDAVIGYDFFKSFIVLLNRREMQLSFKPAGK